MKKELKIRQFHPNAEKHSIIWLFFKPSTHIFGGIAENFPRVKRLFIVTQSITFVENENFVGLETLEELHLQHNLIETLPEDAFEGLVNMKQLHLSYNRIKEIPEQIFCNLKAIQVIAINSNAIMKFPSKLFKANKQLRVIATYKNPANSNDLDISQSPGVKLYNESKLTFYQGNREL
jgi:Leucine-rich repeat (LRR) protein